MSKQQKRKVINDFGGIMFSTNPDFHFDEPDETTEILTPQQQDLRILLDRKNRGGKVVTLITGFIGSEDELQSLTKALKVKCGVGGAAKDGEIVLQGDFREKVFIYLQKEGYKIKKSGG